MFNSFLKNYFGFNKQQRNGLLVLIVISFLLLSIRLSLVYFIRPKNIVVENLPLIEQQLDSIAHKINETRHKDYHAKRIKNLFVFDPNTVSKEQLLQLGFKENTAKTLIKFRSKGGKFKQKEDLLKVYGITKDYYNQIASYVLIKQAVQTPIENLTTFKVNRESETKKGIEPIELNSADSLSLIKIKGIGPSFTKRILKYRNVLNGFYSVEQLKEVYGFSEDLFHAVKSNFYVKQELIKPIHLNSADFKSINKHPYITYELTKIICNARLKSPLTPQIFEALVADEVLYARLLPYCVFD